jgi:guanylate kinase
VFDNRYGTPRSPVEAALSAGQDVLFDIDWQGTQQLREKARQDLLSVFILPPSAADLEKRLHTRAQDSDAVIADRMRRAADEIDHWAEYEYVLVNRDMDACLAQVQSIVSAERSKRVRQTGLVEFVRELIGPAH